MSRETDQQRTWVEPTSPRNETFKRQQSVQRSAGAIQWEKHAGRRHPAHLPQHFPQRRITSSVFSTLTSGGGGALLCSHVYPSPPSGVFQPCEKSPPAHSSCT